MKKIYITWASFSTRSHNLAKHFKAKEFFVFYFSSDGKIIKAFVRYLISFTATFRILLREKPDVIFALNQPLPLLFALYIFTTFFRGRYILDSHSGPFNDPILRPFQPIYRFFAKHAFLNINTNRNHKSLVESWGGKSYIIGDVPIDFKKEYPLRIVKEKSIAVVTTFMFDEPLEEIWKAACLCDDVNFHVTGNYHKASAELLKSATKNIIFEGYIPRDDYIGLLLSVKGVMVLTTRDQTMQMGAYESLSLEKPIITSNWQILRDSFGIGAVYVDNTSNSISIGIRELFENYDKYRLGVKEQRKKRRIYFEKVKRDILTEISVSFGDG